VGIDRATIHLEGGKILLVEAHKTPTNMLVKATSYNGKTIAKPTINHADLARGGTPTFDMFAGSTRGT
jgi:putative alpha-1,2-mannosidase